MRVLNGIVDKKNNSFSLLDLAMLSIFVGLADELRSVELSPNYLILFRGMVVQ